MNQTVILVHPSSLLAAEWEGVFSPFHWEKIKDDLRRAEPENRFVFSGGLIPNKGLAFELKLMADVVNPALKVDPEQKALRAAAQKISKLRPRDKILVTGAWADPDSGCASAVYDRLLEIHQAPVELSKWSPLYGDSWECSKEKVALLKKRKRWCDNSGGLEILDKHGFGALDGGCFLYAQAAWKWIRGGRFCGIYDEKRRLQHFVLEIRKDLYFDGDGLSTKAALLDRMKNLELIPGPRIHVFASPQRALEAARRKEIPHKPEITFK